MEIKTYSVLIEGKPFEGTATQILTAISHKNFFITYKDLNEFIEQSVRDIWRLYAIGISVVGKTIEEKSESMINQLIEHNLLKEVDDSIITSLDIALDKSSHHDKVYLVGWIDNLMQRRLLHEYEGNTIEDKYKEAKKDFDDLLSFDFPDGESIWIRAYN